MKVDRVLILLFAIGATSSLMSMEKEAKKNKAHLNFVLDHNSCIIGHSKYNMDYAIKPAKFLDQNILDVFSLQNEERKAISQALSDAITLKKVTQAQYTLEEKKYIAKVTAFKTTDKFYNYIIKVQEAKK